MQAKELTEDERKALFALLAHLAVADSGISAGEFAEFEALGEEMGISSVHEALGAARASCPTPDAALKLAAGVTRPDAREMIRTLLHDLAGADGARGESEAKLLASIASLWPRG